MESTGEHVPGRVCSRLLRASIIHKPPRSRAELEALAGHMCPQCSAGGNTGLVHYTDPNRCGEMHYEDLDSTSFVPALLNCVRMWQEEESARKKLRKNELRSVAAAGIEVHTVEQGGMRYLHQLELGRWANNGKQVNKATREKREALEQIARGDGVPGVATCTTKACRCRPRTRTHHTRAHRVRNSRACAHTRARTHARHKHKHENYKNANVKNTDNIKYTMCNI